MYTTVQNYARQFAQRLGLCATYEALSLSQRKLQKEYFDRFQKIRDEIKSMAPAG